MREETLAEARAFANEHFDEALDLLRTLGRIPAPSHDEGRRAEFILGWLQERGASAAYIDDAKNVICPITSGCTPGDDGSKLAVFSAHTDVVFPDTTPLPLDERDGRIFCPGIGDDTANLVCLLLATAHLLAHPRPLRRGLLVVANACEEGLGNLAGTKAVFSAYEGRIATFASLDCNLPEVVTGAVGSHRWRVTISTQGGHSWRNFGRANAIEQMARLVCDLYGMELANIGGARTTINVGTIEGGSTVNSIAQHAQILFEYRSTSEQCLAEQRRRFEAVLETHRAAGVQVTSEVVGVRPGMGAVDEDAHASFVALCDDVVQSVSGLEPCHTDSSTDANVPLSLGIPATTVGAIVGGLAHTREEWVETESLRNGCAIALGLLLSE